MADFRDLQVKAELVTLIIVWTRFRSVTDWSIMADF